MIGVAWMRPGAPDRASEVSGGPAEAHGLREQNLAAARSFDTITAINGILLIVLGGGWLVHVSRRRIEAGISFEPAGDSFYGRAAALRRPEEPSQIVGHRIWLALILLLALVVRWPGLGHSLWYDEIYTVQTYLPAEWRGIMTDFAAPNNHILYTLLLKAWNGLVPSGLVLNARIVGWRVLSVVLGTGAVFATWAMAHRMLSARAALAAAAWFAVWPIAVDLSQQLRGYALAMALGAAATALLLHLLRSGCGWWLYVLLSIAMLYTHPLTLVVLMGHVAAAWTSRRESSFAFKRFALSTLVIAMGTAQLYGLLIPDALRNAREQANPVVPHSTPGEYLLDVCRDLGARTGPAWLSLPFVVIAALGGVWLARQNRTAAVAVIVPPALLITAGIVWPPLRETRFLPIIAPQLAVLLLCGALAVISWMRNRWAAVPLAAYPAACCIAGLATIYRLPVQAIREAMLDVRRGVVSRTIAIGLGAPECTLYDPTAVKAFTASDVARLMANTRIGRIVVPYPRTWLEPAAQRELRELFNRSFRIARVYRGRLREDPNVVTYEPIADHSAL